MPLLKANVAPKKRIEDLALLMSNTSTIDTETRTW
jgi:hypothetical protein